jgi:hypothetical protein
MYIPSMLFSANNYLKCQPVFNLQISYHVRIKKPHDLRDPTKLRGRKHDSIEDFMLIILNALDLGGTTPKPEMASPKSGLN